MMRFDKSTGEPIYPIGYVQTRNAMNKKRSICAYTPEGRKEIHDSLRVNMGILTGLMRMPLYGRSVEYADNRISLYSAHWGNCAVTGIEFEAVSDIHCHHKTRKRLGGGDNYQNLILVLEPVHKLIHATKEETITAYRNVLNLDSEQLAKVNSLRKIAGYEKIA
jgi:hypothetical protein